MTEAQFQTKSVNLTRRHFFGAIGTLVITGAVVWFSGVLPMPNGFAINRANETAAVINQVRPMPVNVMKVNYVESIEQSRNFTGMLRAKNRSELGFELSGKILEVLVDEGDKLEKGDPIARLDIDTLVAQKNAILASIDQANSVLSELKSGPRAETIKAASGNRDATRSQYDMAKTNLTRREGLRQQGAISAEEYDQASFQLRTAAANLQVAEEKLAELVAGTRFEKLDAQTSLVRKLEAAQEELDVAISKSTLSAPFSGTVTERYLDPGNIAQASVPIIRLVDEKNLEAWIGLPVTTVADLKIGSQQQIFVNGSSYPATLSAKIPELDPVTRTQTVVLCLAPYDHPVVSGQLCEIKISNQTLASGFWIPTSALAKGVRGLWSVMALAPTTSAHDASANTSKSTEIYRAEKQDVEVIHTESNRVFVRGTLEDGDEIIADGVHRIANGQQVEKAGG